MSLSISKKILAWYKKHQRDLPWRKFKSEKDRHYKVLLSEFMLQQTQVKTAIPYFNNFYKKISSLDQLSKTTQFKVNKLWQGLGYYRRAKFLLKSAKVIKKKFKSKLPKNYDELIQLPGVGDYTAKAILSIAHDKSEIGIDGNVKRVVSRIFSVQDNKKIPIYLEKLKVKKNASSLMQGIMELGAIVCKPTKPLCDKCCLMSHCKFLHKKNKKNIILNKITKKVKKLVACIYIKNNKILLTKNQNLGPLKGFINVPILDNFSNNLKKDLDFFFKQNINYSILGKLNISISNFKAEILCINIYHLKIIDDTFSFYSHKQLDKKFISSFLNKILKKVEFIH